MIQIRDLLIGPKEPDLKNVGWVSFDKNTQKYELKFFINGRWLPIVSNIDTIEPEKIEEIKELIEWINNNGTDFNNSKVSSITWNNYNDPSDMNDFVVAGVYDIKGERKRENDNLPILNTGGGHTISARLEVLDSSINDTTNSDDKCITQKLTLSNRVGGDGNVYIRTGRGKTYDSITWEPWSTLQRNVNVGQVDTLDNLIDNGIYSGVWTDGSSFAQTFVMVVINDYAIAGDNKTIVQYKYAYDTLKGNGEPTYNTRSLHNGVWSDWEDCNEDIIKELEKELTARIQGKSGHNNPLDDIVYLGNFESYNELSKKLETLHSEDPGELWDYCGLFTATIKMSSRVFIMNSCTSFENDVWQQSIIGNVQVVGVKKELDFYSHGMCTVYRNRIHGSWSAWRHINEGITTMTFTPDDSTIELETETEHGNVDYYYIHAATTETAGVMSAKDKRTLDDVNSVINIGEYQNIQAVWDACKQVALNNPEISIIKYSVKAGRTYNSGIVFQMYHYNDAIVSQYYLYGGGQKHECNIRHIVSDGTTDDWQPIQMFTSYKFENGTLYGYKYGKSESEQNKVPIVDIPNNGSAVAELMQEVTYSELVALRNTNKLVAGMKYRITDYVTTTVQKYTKSANHPFDVIVEAVSENELSELAQAIQHEGDTYFDGNDLGAWQLWYDLDNNTDKYEWADAENGKGVIYRMIDEKRNDCPYDFKNILFIRCKLNAPVVGGYTYEWQNKMSENINKMFEKNHLSYIWHGNNNEEDYYWEDDMGEVISSPTGETKAFFTFSNVVNDIVTDKSITSVCHNNIIKESVGTQLRLNNIVFFSTGIDSSCNSNSFGNDCYYNSFGNSCNYNSFGNDCNYNSFGNSCNYNSFGNYCDYNSFGNSCYSNSFGNYCDYNSFGNSCYYNSFGNYCYSNSFGNSCYSNSFGNSCYSNSFGNSCYSNSFGNYCDYNSFGNSCYYNSFGNYCDYNSFRDGPAYVFNEDYWEYSYDDVLIDGVRGNKFGDRCQNLLIYTHATTGEENSIQNLNIAQGLCSIELDDNDIFIPLPIEIDIVGQDYELKIARNTGGEVKIYCEADLV